MIASRFVFHREPFAARVEIVMAEDLNWSQVQQALPIGTLVSCIVTAHRPFGVFTEIDGIPFAGLIQITDFKDHGQMTVEEYPPIGSKVNAVILGYKETGQQIWLGIKSG